MCNITSAPGSVFVIGLDGLHHNRASTLNEKVIGGWHRSVAAPPHSAGKGRLAHPPLRKVQRQATMVKRLSSSNVVQITPVPARRDLPRAQHGSGHRRKSARDRTAECLSDLYPNVHWDLYRFALARQSVQPGLTRADVTTATHQRNARQNPNVRNRSWFWTVR